MFAANAGENLIKQEISSPDLQDLIQKQRNKNLKKTKGKTIFALVKLFSLHVIVGKNRLLNTEDGLLFPVSLCNAFAWRSFFRPLSVSVCFFAPSLKRASNSNPPKLLPAKTRDVLAFLTYFSTIPILPMHRGTMAGYQKQLATVASRLFWVMFCKSHPKMRMESASLFLFCFVFALFLLPSVISVLFKLHAGTWFGLSFPFWARGEQIFDAVLLGEKTGPPPGSR